jgi:hypothetical protein
VRSLALVLVAFAVFAAVLPASASAQNGPLEVAISGPSALAPSQTAGYNFTITGGPTGNITYSLSYYISGTNTTGGNPISTSPGSRSGNQTTYAVNVTAPSLEQTITLSVTVIATSKAGPSENVTRAKTITVIRGIILSATFHNTGSTAAMNVTVQWAIDGTLVGTTILKQVGANADATATFTYLPATLSPGEHTVTVSADLDHDGTINPARGEVVTSTIFYNHVEQTAPGWAFLLAIGIFVPVFLGVVALRRRGER